MHQIRIKGSNTVIHAIFVLWLGNPISGKVAVLQKYSIPLAVTGGLICSLIVPLVGAFFIDILNALVIQFFIGLAIMQQAISP